MTINDLMESLESLKRELEYRLEHFGDHGLGEHAVGVLEALIAQVYADALAEMPPVKAQSCRITLPEGDQ